MQSQPTVAIKLYAIVNIGSQRIRGFAIRASILCGLWKRNERYYAQITVYGHWSNEHAQRQTRRMVFEPVLANDDEKQGAEA